MYPNLFKYKSLEISSYGFMLMTAFLICNYLLKRYLISIKEDGRKADDIIFYAAIGGILGGKIYYIIEQILCQTIKIRGVLSVKLFINS